MAQRVIRVSGEKLSDILRVSTRRIREVCRNSKLQKKKGETGTRYDLVEAIGDYIDQSRQGNKDHVTLKRLAEILGTTDRHIRNLVDENILSRLENDKYDLIESVRKFINYMRANNANQRYKDAQTERLLLKVDKEKGKLHSTEDIELIFSNYVINNRKRLMALPSKLSKELVEKKDRLEIEDIIQKHLYEAMQELSEYENVASTTANGETIQEDL